MDNLRLILLIIGGGIIALIYFWSTLAQRKQQRKRTIHQAEPDIKLPDFNEDVFLAEEESHAVGLSNLDVDDVGSEHSIFLEEDGTFINDEKTEEAVQDLFPQEKEAGGVVAEEQPTEATSDLIVLHITALPTQPFSGVELLRALDLVEMEYGEMNIFHHHGVGEMRSTEPLFSLANMHEPGSFDLNNISKEEIKGLTLFLRLPTPVDAQIAFELMLNTTQRLSDELKGEVRGPSHRLLNEKDISELRDKLAAFSED